MPHENGRLTDEELQPHIDDIVFAASLVNDGWLSTSNSGRRVARWKQPPRLLRDLIRPEMLDTPEAKYYLRRGDISTFELRTPPPGLEREELVLTVRQFRAFKLLGGRVA